MTVRGQSITDMTEGKPLPLILKLALPLMGGQFLQQFYVVADAAIVGQGVGVTALAAIGATDWLYWLFLWTAAGFGQGFAIPVAICFGKKDYRELRNSIYLSVSLSTILGCMMSAIGLFAAKPLLQLLDTPSNLMPYSYVYLMILYGGICVVMLYNMASCILRALGDGKTPLIALLLSSCLNVALDLLFVMVFGWGITGAGVATVFSQLVSTVYCFVKISRLRMLREEKPDRAIHWKQVWTMMGYGAPIAGQMAFTALGGIALQYILNGFGFLYVAGFTATNKLFGVLEAIALALGYAMSTYMGQNYGARKPDRIQAGMRAALLISVLVSAGIGILMILFGKRILLLFISADSAQVEEVLTIGYQYLFIMSIFLIFLHMVSVYRQSLAGLGNTIIPMLSGLLEGVFRAGGALVFTTILGSRGLFFVEVTAWIGGAVLACAAYYITIRKKFGLQRGFKNNRS